MAKLRSKNTLPNSVAAAVDITRLHEQHSSIRAQDWRSPLVFRLIGRKKYADGSVLIADSFRAEDTEAVASQLPLQWAGLKDDFNQCVNTYQDPVLTEFATLGLACILLSRHTNFRISEVTRRGERVDYWIGDSNVRKRFVLEVGGQQTGSIDQLSIAKTKQLNENPWGRNGFICVAVYGTSDARLWFCTNGSAS